MLQEATGACLGEGGQWVRFHTTRLGTQMFKESRFKGNFAEREREVKEQGEEEGERETDLL